MLQVRILPRDQLVEVLSLSPEDDVGSLRTAQLIIAAAHDGEMLTMICADGSRATVPLSVFRPSGDGTAPDFSRFELDDHGHTIVFGEYEAAADYALTRPECEHLKGPPKPQS